MFFLLVVFLLSWYHWSDATWLRNLQKKCNRFTSSLQQSASQVLLPSKGSTNLQDDDELSFLEDKKSYISDDISGATAASKPKAQTLIRKRKSSF